MAINAAAFMAARAHAAWTNRHIAGVILMDIMATFPSIAKGTLINKMKVREMDADLIYLTKSFFSELNSGDDN